MKILIIKIKELKIFIVVQEIIYSKKNSFLLRTENSEIKINKKNLKCNYLKIYINTSSQKKQRDNYSKSKEKNIFNKINKKINNIPHSAYYTRDNCNNIKGNNNSQLKNKIITERNEKIRGYIKKYNSQYGNGITPTFNEKNYERNNQKILKRLNNELNSINYKNLKKGLYNNYSNYRKIDLNKKDKKEDKILKNKRKFKKKEDNSSYLEISNKRNNNKFQFIKERNNSYSNQKNKTTIKNQIISELKEKNEDEDICSKKINEIKSIKIK